MRRPVWAGRRIRSAIPRLPRFSAARLPHPMRISRDWLWASRRTIRAKFTRWAPGWESVSARARISTARLRETRGQTARRPSSTRAIKTIKRPFPMRNRSMSRRVALRRKKRLRAISAPETRRSPWAARSLSINSARRPRINPSRRRSKRPM